MKFKIKPQYKRKGCRDIFNAYMVEKATFSDENEIPYCPTTLSKIPKKIIMYDEAKKSTDYDSIVGFYKDDYKFDGNYSGIWHDGKRSLEVLSKFEGVITPDFSTNPDFPYPLRIYNTYRMRAFGFWLVKNGLKVVNNVRPGDESTWKYCFDGISKNSIVAISTLGCILRLEDRKRFKLGINKMVEVLRPHTILVYGSAPDDIFNIHKAAGINIISYESEISQVYKKEA